MDESEPNLIPTFQLQEALGPHLIFNNNRGSKINLQTPLHEMVPKIKICLANPLVDVDPRQDLHQSRERLFKTRCLNCLRMLEEEVTFSTNRA